MIGQENQELSVFLSICIPSFNRPNELVRLISSIEFSSIPCSYEILIAEDFSPNREAIINSIYSFDEEIIEKIRLILNVTNLGYDGNIRNLIENSRGDYIIFMGDDDFFVQGRLRDFILFLLKNTCLSYVLTGHRVLINDSDKYKIHRYFKKNTFFEPSIESVVALFRKSVYIAGFTFKRKLFEDFENNSLDGTLLFQLYVLALLVDKFPSAYYDCDLVARYRDNIPYFGSSEIEKTLYEPGSTSVASSINFMKSYLKLLDYLKSNRHIDIKDEVILDISKYSYPILSIQRHRGIKTFLKYTYQLKDIGLAKSLYFYFYAIALTLFGENICDEVILFVKKTLRFTPNL